ECEAADQSTGAGGARLCAHEAEQFCRGRAVFRTSPGERTQDPADCAIAGDFAFLERHAAGYTGAEREPAGRSGEAIPGGSGSSAGSRGRADRRSRRLYEDAAAGSGRAVVPATAEEAAAV